MIIRASDGASSYQGIHKGSHAIHKNYNPYLQSIHRSSHK